VLDFCEWTHLHCYCHSQTLELMQRNPLVFHIVHKKLATSQVATFRNSYMSYGVLYLLKLLEVQKV
jgi:hypothetical protein